jgi:hypothetical protein
MVQKSFIGLFGTLYGLVLCLALPAIAQNTPPKPKDVEVDRVQAMITQAKNEVRSMKAQRKIQPQKGTKGTNTNHFVLYVPFCGIHTF